MSPVALALAGGFFNTEQPGKPMICMNTRGTVNEGFVLDCNLPSQKLGSLARKKYRVDIEIATFCHS